jgi:hypothetical protein
MLEEPNHKKMLTPASPNGLYLKKITYKWPKCWHFFRK